MNSLRHGSGVSCKMVTATSVFLLALVLGTAGVLGYSGGGEPADVPVGYGGQAYGVYVEVPFFGGTYYADTGSLPAEGGVLVADFTPVETGVADATVFLSYTRGFTDLAMSEVATSDIGLLAGTPAPVTADFGYTISQAACYGASGATQLSDLRVAGLPVDVTGEPNQVYEVPGILTLIINEQVDSSWGDTNAITVNALHAYASGVEVIVSSAYSSITCDGSGGLLALGGTVPALGGTRSGGGGGIEPYCGFPGCDKELRDFVTGGGFFVPDDCVTRPNPCVRVNFGFNAGPRPGNPTLRGHLNVVDHTIGDHVSGVNVQFYEALPEDPENCRRFGGQAKFNGVPGFFYATLVCDYGEPGRDDHFAVCVTTAPNCGGAEVYFADNRDFDSEFVEGGELDGGNIQLHRFR